MKIEEKLANLLGLSDTTIFKEIQKDSSALLEEYYISYSDDTKRSSKDLLQLKLVVQERLLKMFKTMGDLAFSDTDISFSPQGIWIQGKAADQFKELLNLLTSEISDKSSDKSSEKSNMHSTIEVALNLEGKLDRVELDKKNDVYTLRLNDTVPTQQLEKISKAIKDKLKKIEMEKEKKFGFGTVEVFSESEREIRILDRAAVVLSGIKVTQKIENNKQTLSDKKDILLPHQNTNNSKVEKNNQKINQL